jgi:hypothetical protein
MDTVNGVFDKLKEFGLDKIAFAIAQQLTERMTQRLLNWANDGFEGNPFYVEDRGALAKEIALDSFEGIVSSYTASDSPWINAVVKAVDVGRTVYQDGITLDEIFGEDWEEIAYDDFEAGGWGGYSALYDPSNNVIGTQLLTEAQTTVAIKTKRGQVEMDLLSNDGFLSVQTCIATNLEDPEFEGKNVEVTYDPDRGPWMGYAEDFPAENFRAGYMEAYITPPAPAQAPGSALPPAPAVPQPITVTCTQYETETPGKLIGKQIEQTTGIPLERTGQVEEFGELIFGSLQQLVVGLSEAGLKKLSSSINPGLKDLTSPGGPGSDDDNLPEDWLESPALSLDLDSELYGSYTTEDENGEPISYPGELVQDANGDPVPLPDNPTGNEVPAATPNGNNVVAAGEILPDGTTATQQTILPVALIREGAVELIERELDIRKDTLYNQSYGLASLPEKIMELDHCLPGPDGPGETWVGRLRDKIRDEKNYQQAQSKASKKDNEKGEALTSALQSVNFNIGDGVTDVRLSVLDTDKNIPSYQEIVNIVIRIRAVNSMRTEQEEALLRASTLLGNIKKIASDYENATSEFEKAQQRFKFSELSRVPSPSIVEGIENERTQVIALEELVTEYTATCQEEVNDMKTADPIFAQRYDSGTLWCSGQHPYPANDLKGTQDYIVDRINEDWDHYIDECGAGSNCGVVGDLNLTCSDFYTSNITDYIESEHY